MCNKINNKLKEIQPIMIGILLFIVVILICFLVFNKNYAMTLQLGDKQVKITPPDLVVAFGEFGDSMVEIFNIQTHKKPAEQKAYLKDIFKSISQKIFDHHIKLRKKLGLSENCYTDNDFQAYVNITDKCMDDMQEVIVLDFLRLEEINKNSETEELNIFIKNCTIKYIIEYGEKVKKRWSLNKITADENYKWTRAIVPEIMDDLDNIFRKAYKIKIKYDIIMEELKKKKVTIQSNYK